MKFKKGFTLIELLVVISIIGLLASVVLSNLNTARSRAKDAAVRSGVKEMEKLFLFVYQEDGSYAASQGNGNSNGWWFPNDMLCSNLIMGNYTTDARKICQNIVDNAGMLNGSPNHRFHIGLVPTTYDINQNYSIIGMLSNNKAFCVGSSGVTDNSSDITYWSDTGCLNNP